MKGRLRKMKKAARGLCAGRRLGTCTVCRTTVFASDERVHYRTGYAHESCVAYRSKSRGRS